jgi:hypothetical protein
VLELGKSGAHGTERGTVPVLSGDAVVATLRASNWKEAAAAQVGDRSWVFRRAGGRPLAESGTTGGCNPRPTLTPSAELSLDHAVFLLWFELLLGRRSAAAAAAV